MVKQEKLLSTRPYLGVFSGRPVAATQDRPAFEQVWQVARLRVWRLTARLSGNLDAADDLTQEIAVQALRGYETFRGDADTTTWLFRIAIHTVMRYREKRQTADTRTSRVSLDDLEDGDSARLLAPPSEQPENRLLETEATPAIRRALDALPDELRIPLILHIYEEMKCREIAETLSVPLGTVLSRLHGARQRMRTILERENGNAK